MYEQHLGLTAPAFAAQADADLYFASRNHADVLAEMRYGVYRGEGFVVVIGDAGTGKTMLAHMLLADIKPDKVVAVQLPGVPLGDGELVPAILKAFGLNGGHGTRSHNLAALEDHLLKLVTQGRRGLLLIDQAQGLSNQALDELRHLSTLQLGTLALLQVFLLGQPALARMLNAASMAPLRQRVLNSSRLHPLPSHETAAYIEHRLRARGWRGQPAIEPAAHAALHRASAGVPRQINLLCERVFDAASAAAMPRITPELVQQVEHLRDSAPPGSNAPGSSTSVDDGMSISAPVSAPVSTPVSTPVSAKSEPLSPLHGAPANGPVALSGSPWQLPTLHGNLAGAPLVCVAGTLTDMLKARVLNHYLQAAPGAMDMVIVSPQAQGDTPLAQAGLLGLKPAHMEMHLAVNPAGYAQCMAEVLRRFDALLEVLLPRAVLVLGDTPASLACALVARQRGLRVTRLDAGLRGGNERDPQALNAALLDRTANLLFAAHPAAQQNLRHEGLGDNTSPLAGSVLVELVAHAERQGGPLPALLHRTGARAQGLELGRGYVLATLKVPADDPWPADVADALRALRPQAPVLWLVDDASRQAMAGSGFAQRLERDGVCLVNDATAIEQLCLARHARAVLADAARVLADEAQALGTPVLLYDSQGVLGPAQAGTGGAVVEDAEETLRAFMAVQLRRAGAGTGAGIGAGTGAAESGRHGAGLGAARHIAEQLQAWLADTSPVNQ